MKSSPRKQTIWITFALVGILASSGLCAQDEVRPGDNRPPGQIESQTTEADADSDTLYGVLAGELAGVDGDLEKAASEYLAAALDSDDPAVAQRATEVAAAAGQWQLAAMASDRWVLLSPEDLFAREAAIKSLLAAGDYVGAEHQIEGFLERTADKPWGGWRAISILLSPASNAEKTADVIQHLMDSFKAGDNAYALLAMSQATARQGNFKDAVSWVEKAIEAAPGEADLHAWAGRLALTTRNHDKALHHYREAWALDSESRMHALVYAEFLRQSGDPELANEVFDSLPDTPENRFTRIAFALESGYPDLAARLYEGFNTEEYEDPVDTALRAARSAELLGRSQDAIEWYSKLEGTDQETVGLMRRAILLASQGEVDQARDLLQTRRETSSGTVRLDTFAVEAQILINSGERDAAFELLGTAINEYPEDPRIRYTRALLAVEKGQLELAETDLREVIAREPRNAAALNALGYTLADLTDRLDEAQALIRAAFELQPEEPSIIDSMGWVAYRQGRMGEAEAYLRQAFMKDQNPEIAAHLGEVLWQQGRKDDARVIWQQGLQLDDGNKTLIDTLERFGVEPE